jgi:hypothetical protein
MPNYEILTFSGIELQKNSSNIEFPNNKASLLNTQANLFDCNNQQIGIINLLINSYKIELNKSTYLTATNTIITNLGTLVIIGTISDVGLNGLANPNQLVEYTISHATCFYKNATAVTIQFLSDDNFTRILTITF